MFETVYMTSAEKKEFLKEFASEMIIALIRQQEYEREQALEKVKLIIRQFPDLSKRVRAASAIKSVEIKSTEQFLTGTGKVDSLLNDHSVNIIECLEGSIRISRGHGIEETGFSMNETEIKEFVKKLSEKTKIPLAGNLFKVNYGNLIVNAILSDEIGSRFLILKRLNA